MEFDVFEMCMTSKEFRKIAKLHGFSTLDKLNEFELNNKFWDLQNKIDAIGSETLEVEVMTFLQNKIVVLQEEKGLVTCV